MVFDKNGLDKLEEIEDKKNDIAIRWRLRHTAVRKAPIHSMSTVRMDIFSLFIKMIKPQRKRRD